MGPLASGFAVTLKGQQPPLNNSSGLLAERDVCRCTLQEAGSENSPSRRPSSLGHLPPFCIELVFSALETPKLLQGSDSLEQGARAFSSMCI